MPSVHNREVISPRDPIRQSPFILMVEDRIGNVGEFGIHAHRGFITVTIMLAGQMEHVESCDGLKPGVLSRGDVQWMTTGHGIRHGGRPVGGQPVHSLQLWLNLPAVKKMTAAASVVQRSDGMESVGGDGVAVKLYAGRWGDVVRPYQSLWPMTLMDIALQYGHATSIILDLSDRAFLYVIEGEAIIGDSSRQSVKTGEVAWFGPDGSADTRITLTGGTACRAIYGAAKPIEEPISAGAGFVMNSAAEVEQAYADLRAGIF